MRIEQNVNIKSWFLEEVDSVNMTSLKAEVRVKSYLQLIKSLLMEFKTFYKSQQR